MTRFLPFLLLLGSFGFLQGQSVKYLAVPDNGGVLSTSGADVTSISGYTFSAGNVGQTIVTATIANCSNDSTDFNQPTGQGCTWTQYTISAYVDSTHVTLSSSAGTKTNVSWCLCAIYTWCNGPNCSQILSASQPQ